MVDNYVIILNGRPTAGKDTFVEMVKKYCDMYDYAWVSHISSVNPIKEFLTDKLGWDGNKDDATRKLMADIKKYWDSRDGYTSVSYCVGEILEYINAEAIKKDDKIIFVDIREPYNISKIVKSLNALKDVFNIKTYTVFIDRPQVAVDHGNASDDNVENFVYDAVIFNNGTYGAFEKLAHEFVESLLKGGLDNGTDGNTSN